MMYDLKKLEENFYQFYENCWEWKFYEKDEIKITEELLEQQEGLHIPFGVLSYFLVIKDEKPVLYVRITTKMGDDLIGFIDENGDKGYDLSNGSHEDILEKYNNQLQKVKGFKDLKMPKNKMKNKE